MRRAHLARRPEVRRHAASSSPSFMPRLVSLQEEEVRTQTHAEGRPGEDTGKRRHRSAQERGLGRNQPCRHLDLGVLQTVRKSVSCLNCPVCGALLRGPEPTPTLTVFHLASHTSFQTPGGPSTSTPGFLLCSCCCLCPGALEPHCVWNLQSALETRDPRAGEILVKDGI